MTVGFKEGNHAVKVWITAKMQKAMDRYRPAVNWSRFIREAIERKLKNLEDR